MPKEAVETEWRVATDERMHQLTQKGVTIAPPELGHSAHVEIIGLRPARNYFYEFRIGVETSHIGRAHTLPFSRGYRRSGRASETWDVNATKTASS